MTQLPAKTPEQIAQEIIEGAKSIIVEELGKGLEVTWKADDTPVTQIDTRINELAIARVSEHFPGDAIYAEEGNGGAGTSGYTWVIDPIDGTRALEMGLPTYTVCIARVNPAGQSDFSFVYNPSTEDMYTSREGEKAMKNAAVLTVAGSSVGLKGEQVYVSSRMPAIAMKADELCRRLERAGAERITTHSLAFGALLVAEGTFVAAIAGTSEPYELASVKPIIEGAGGVVSDLEGNPIERCDGRLNGFIVAANETTLREIVRLYQDKEAAESNYPDPLKIIRQYAPGAQRIQPVRSGYVNDVYIVDETYVFRFPKTDKWRRMVLFETDVLKKLAGHVSLAIPVVKHVESDGSYTVFSYIKGAHHNSADIRAMDVEAKRAFARSIAAFLIEMNNAVPRDWMAQRLADLPVARKDDAKYYERLLRLGRENNSPYVDRYQQQYDRLMTIRDEIFSADEIVIHGDLHSGNFIFDEHDKLAGIFDFGDCMLNTVYFELRQLYHFGDDVLDMTIEALGSRFGSISRDAVRLVAITHEFSILMRLGSPEETPYDEDRGAIAKKLLRRWDEL